VASNNDRLLQALYFLRRRQRAYIDTFNLHSPNVQLILKDLARFCRAHKSTGHKDPIVAARLDGRREVWLRMQQHLRLSDANLWSIMDGRPHPEQQTDGE
jgi:hypothetical protein